ncbi:MAG: hypothetical protein M2R45_01621 [Verrucomicrobia subdivision 3 bacterium]|nr:hypothetical protein [Limisphaerales bacterium]MCS1412772.1 hypothetical protein [Limisphaerales bacterium]
MVVAMMRPKRLMRIKSAVLNGLREARWFWPSASARSTLAMPTNFPSIMMGVSLFEDQLPFVNIWLGDHHLQPALVVGGVALQDEVLAQSEARATWKVSDRFWTRFLTSW